MSENYLRIAEKEFGVHETPGPQATARIVEYDSHTTLKATTDETPWCSAFANFVVDTAGDKGTHSAAARSWLSWGKPIVNPAPGCIVVLDRHDAANPNAAHVTFFVAELPGGFIKCLGGNQGDQVKYSNFPASKVLGYRVAT